MTQLKMHLGSLLAQTACLEAVFFYSGLKCPEVQTHPRKSKYLHVRNVHAII
jgi:hypothetical protein